MANPKLILARQCVEAFQRCMAPEMRRKREGIAYLIGLSLPGATLAVSALRPEAKTGSGFFSVSASAMAAVVRRASDLNLHVVGQVHTHPSEAFHSDGDDEGARIAYPGYASIVIPDYGRRLPSLRGAVFFAFTHERKFDAIHTHEVCILEGAVS